MVGAEAHAIALGMQHGEAFLRSESFVTMFLEISYGCIGILERLDQS